MRMLGIVVTTITEMVEVDLPDDAPDGEIGEIFTKTVMALSPQKPIGKAVQYHLLSKVVDEPAAKAEK